MAADSARPRPQVNGAHDSARSLPSEPPALFDRRRLARELGVSLRHLDSLRSRGALPKPIRFGDGRLVRWPQGAKR